MRHSYLLLAIAFQFHASVLAQNDEVKQGPMPDWVQVGEPLAVPADASGMAFVRNHTIAAHLDEKGQVLHSAYRIKILHPNALSLGNLSLVWNPASGGPTVHKIQIHRDGASIDALPTTKFEILRREDQLEMAMLSGMLTAVAKVNDLRVGDELEFAFSTRSLDPTMGNREAGQLFLAPNTTPGRYDLRLSWTDGQAPALKISEDIAPIAVRGTNSISFRFDNPPILKLAKDAPPRFNWHRRIEFSDFGDWGQISRQFHVLFEKASLLSQASPLKQEAARIMAVHSDPQARASAALKLVQQDVRYIFVGLDGGNLQPATAEETWQRRYGDCKGKTALLLSLLREMGISAEAVLANNAGNDDGLNNQMPNPASFDHVLVRAQIDGKLLYMDGTLPFVATPSSVPVYPYRWILPLTSAGSEIESLPWKAAKVPDEISLVEIDSREGFDKPAKQTTTFVQRGLKGLLQQIQFSSVTPDQLEEIFKQDLADDWDVIDSVKWHFDIAAQASILTIVGTQTAEWDLERRGSRGMSLPGGGFSPPDKRIRPEGQNQSLPFSVDPDFDCHLTTVRLPTSTKGVQWSHNKGFDTRMFGRNYYRAFDYRDGSIRMVRASRAEASEIDAASAIADNGRIAGFDNSMARIYFDLDGMSAPPAGKRAIPAAGQLDLAAADAACLSPTAK